MAIREFGESLLADVRKRKDEQARSARKRADRAALLDFGTGVAVSIGNKLLNKQLTDFNQNKDVLDLNIRTNQATKVGTMLDELDGKMKTSVYKGQDYFTNLYAEQEIQERLQLPENLKWNKDQTGKDTYALSMRGDLLKDEEIKELGKKAYAQYKNASEARGVFEASGSKADALAYAKSQAPSVLGILAGKIRGKSTSDMNQERISGYVSSNYGKNTTEASLFYKILKESGGDFVSSKELANKVMPSDEALEVLSTERTVTTPLGDGRYAVQTWTVGADGKDVGDSVVTSYDLRSDKDKANVMVAQYNAITVAKDLLSPEGYSDFFSGKHGLVHTNPKTITEVDENETALQVAVGLSPKMGNVELTARGAVYKEMLTLKKSENYILIKDQIFSDASKIAELEANKTNLTSKQQQELEDLIKSNANLSGTLLEQRQMVVEEANQIFKTDINEETTTTLATIPVPVSGNINVAGSDSSTILKNIQIISTREEAVVPKESFEDLNLVKEFIKKRGGTLSQDEMDSLIIASKGNNKLVSYLEKNQSYISEEEKDEIQAESLLAIPKKKLTRKETDKLRKAREAQIKKAAGETIDKGLGAVGEWWAKTKLETKAKNLMTLKEKTTYRKTKKFPVRIQKMIDEGELK